MRSQTYSDKQREAQRRKKEEEMWKKSHPEGAPAPEAPADTDKSNHAPNKTKKKQTPPQRSS
jgi:hypothetical protein